MFGITGLMTSNDYRNGTPGPIEAASNLVIFSVSTITDSNWELISQDDKFIKARNENFADVGTVYSVSTLPSVTINSSMAGSHIGSNYPAYSTFRTSPLKGGTSGDGYAGGDHNHTVTINLSGFRPSYIKIKLYKRNYNSVQFYSLPIGALIFGENLDISGLTATSSYNNRYLNSTIGNVVGLNGGSSTGSVSFTTGNSGFHYHGGPTTDMQPSWYNGGYGLNTGPYEQEVGQDHNHTGSITYTQKKKYVKLRTYKVDSDNVFISRGMIFGFISSINDPNWFCCNGQTVRGYTTPNLVDRYIMCGNNNISSHNVKPSVSDDANNITVTNFSVDTNTWNHNHGVENAYYQNQPSTSATRYHTFVDIPHTHGFSANFVGTTYEYELAHLNLIFYIYLP
jgi:hypothetical protein